MLNAYNQHCSCILTYSKKNIINPKAMKKSTIWSIALIMGFSFIVLLFLQISYIEEMTKMKREQFDESVNRALYQASQIGRAHV